MKVEQNQHIDNSKQMVDSSWVTKRVKNSIIVDIYNTYNLKCKNTMWISSEPFRGNKIKSIARGHVWGLDINADIDVTVKIMYAVFKLDQYPPNKYAYVGAIHKDQGRENT